MNTIQLYQVDAFTDIPFHGNPAAVCLLSEPIPERQMQLIANEMNLSETAFVTPETAADVLALRWFTPKCEVPLCVHATIATAAVILATSNKSEICFKTESGLLTAKQNEQGIEIDLPLDSYSQCEPATELLEALSIDQYEDAVLGKRTGKLVIRMPSQHLVRSLRPSFNQMADCSGAGVRGVAVTARGTNPYDFVSRYFNPWAGVNEDPVTGSVHTVLAGYWGTLLQKEELRAYQVSERGGEMFLRLTPHARLLVTGRAVIVMKGELYL